MLQDDMQWETPQHLRECYVDYFAQSLLIPPHIPFRLSCQYSTHHSLEDSLHHHAAGAISGNVLALDDLDQIYRLLLQASYSLLGVCEAPGLLHLRDCIHLDIPVIGPLLENVDQGKVVRV